MSNFIVGTVYQQIMEEVINNSRVDFEEGGVDETVLEELRVGWQQKLSRLNVATFPWDPSPEDEAASSNNASLPSVDTSVPGAGYGQPSSAGSHLPLPGQPNGNGQAHSTSDPVIKMDPDIKQETGISANVLPLPFASSLQENAIQRAAQNLQNRYGQRAAGSISAMQANQKPPAPTDTTRASFQQIPPGPGATSYQQVPQAQQQQPQMPQLPQAPGQIDHMKNSQTDGPSDTMDELEGVLMKRLPNGEMTELGRVDIDRLLHQRMIANAKAMEGGGLMLALKEAAKQGSSASITLGGPSRASKRRVGGQMDGGDEDDVDDDELINSDLDDPESEKEDSEVEDNETLSHIMLCMYDKVQRVKNKWKCVLKDGVLTVNGKEYLFQRANGEYEW